MKIFWLAVVTALLIFVARASDVVAQDTTSMIVEKDRVLITIMPPKLRVRPARSAQFGFYAWRVDIKADMKANDGVSIAFTADSAMRSSSMRDIVSAGTLRGCADPKDFSTLRCKVPMSDSVTLRGEGLRMVIRDSSIVALMWRQRSAVVWASTFEPNGQFRVDRVNVRFVEPDPADVGKSSDSPP